MSSLRLSRPDRSLDAGVIAMATLAIVLAGCAGTPSPRFATRFTVAPRGARQVISVDRVAYAIALLGAGQAQAARAQLAVVPADDPRSSDALLLLREIDGDPATLLGERSHPYRVRPGETMTTLAGRFLGDERLFYALARFNDLTVPDEPLEGRVIRIPGPGSAPRPRRVAHVHPAPAAVAAGPHAAEPKPQKPSAMDAWRLRL
jgi:hypothetical protein